MSLDEKIAYWVDLGRTEYKTLRKLQERVVDGVRAGELPDVYLSGEFESHLDFGSNRAKNHFSDEITQRLKERFGNSYHDSRGWVSDEVIVTLEEEGVEGLPFTVSKRGGGATAYSPGQFNYFPVITLPESALPGDFNEIVDEVMHYAMNQFLPARLKEMGYSETLKGNYKDIHVDHQGKSYKLGSKGFSVKQRVGFGGFNLYMNETGMEHFPKVYVCGFHPSEVGTISAEKITGRQFAMTEVTPHIQEKLQQKLGYTKIKQITPDELYTLLK